jgi:hypothetical protein
MKRTVLIVALLLALTAGTCMASPLNDLGRGQTALGLTSDTFYLEHKLTDNFTLGLQNIDWAGKPTDVYGQLNFGGNLRGIIGSRDYDGGSKLYLGLGVSGPMAPEWDGYASFVAGSKFQEVQVGANFHVAHNVDLNVGYHSFMPDWGSNQTGVGVGATFRF